VAHAAQKDFEVGAIIDPYFLPPSRATSNHFHENIEVNEDQSDYLYKVGVKRIISPYVKDSDHR
jgi:hypothetical protein